MKATRSYADGLLSSFNISPDYHSPGNGDAR